MTSAQRLQTGAALTLLAIAIAAWLTWPLPALGLATDRTTGTVLVVDPDSVAHSAILVGDRITHIYTHTWAERNQRLLLVPLPWRDGTPTPLRLQRGDRALEVTLFAPPPDLALQVDKALRTLVALICWLTGLLLGISPKATNPLLRRTAWFWLLLGAVLGLLPLLQSVSYVLHAAILWVIGSLLAPSAVMVQLWYPSRPMSQEALARAQRWWLMAMALLQVAFLALALRSTTTAGLLDLLEPSTMVSFCASFVLSAVILWRAYRATAIAHLQRQIRLIAIACVLVACVWAILLLGEAINPRLIAPIPPIITTVIAALVPLAYLYSGVVPDLLRADQLARLLATHALAVVAILALLAAATRLGGLELTPLMVVLVILAAYRPTARLLRRLGAFAGEPGDPYAGLHQAVAQLGSTLEAERLAAIIGDGLQATFGGPPVAVYLQRVPTADALEGLMMRDLAMPPVAAQAVIQQVFADQPALLSIGEVHHRVAPLALERAATELVFAPHVTLWGAIRHPQGGLLGLVTLGARGDLDPYRPRDLRELALLLTAASLAVSNSGSYAKQAQAEALIRRLYHHLQQVQDAVAAAIAREIHDEVLNVNLRLNILALERLLERVGPDQRELRDELTMILESEQTVTTLLRLISEQLLLADTDDPLGLPASLRRTIDRLSPTWAGDIQLTVTGPATPVGRHLHHELVRITREAVTNAIKHAGGTLIDVALHLPEEAGAPLTLFIQDNGPTQQPVTAQPGHLGLHFMHESANAIGATITWLPRTTGGTEVRVIATLEGHQGDAPLPGLWWEVALPDAEPVLVELAVGEMSTGPYGAKRVPRV